MGTTTYKIAGSQLTGPALFPDNGPVDRLLIMLHGYGADGHDLIDLAPIFQEAFPTCAVISPNAPEPVAMAPMGRQWFGLSTLSPQELGAGAKKARPILNQFIDACLLDLGMTDENLSLFGFSQGAMMALEVGLRREKKINGIAAFSGALPGAQNLAQEIKTKPPVLLVHGQVDQVVPFAAMEMAKTHLEQLAVPVTCLARPGLGHGIDLEGIDAAVKHFS